MTTLGKTIDDLILDESRWSNATEFQKHVTDVTNKLVASGDITPNGKFILERDAVSSGIGTNGTVEFVADTAAHAGDAVAVYRSLSSSFDAGTSLGGSDLNSDGVRDDIANLIRYFSISSGRKQALLNYAKALRTIVIAPTFDKLTIDQAYSLQLNVDTRKQCLANVSGTASAQLLTDLIRAATANTPARKARLEGFERALSGSSYDAVLNPVCY